MGGASLEKLRLGSPAEALLAPGVETAGAAVDGRSTARNFAGIDVATQQRPGPSLAFPELDVRYDGERGIYWQRMAPQRPSFTLGLLRDMRRALDRLADIANEAEERGAPCPVRYVVMSSRIPTIFNLGGDLPLFVKLIRQGNVEGLRRYARACIAVQYPRAVNQDLPYVSISLVQGDALGGGFEAALADNVIIAERRAKFGFPEVLFGLFPGMGAYSFLSRRVGTARAEQMIMSGKFYDAVEMAALGIVDMVVEDGAGEQAVYDFIRNEERRALARRALYQIRRRVNRVTEDELLDITDLWAETAAQLSDDHLRKMERLTRAQERRWVSIQGAAGQAAE
jgi:DSF synthase